MIECTIQSECGPWLGLDSNQFVALKDVLPPLGPDQYWQLSQGFSQDGVPLGIAIINKSTGGALHSNPDGVKILDLWTYQLNAWCTWTFGTGFHLGGADSGFVAVRPFADTGWNLNVKGGCGNMDLTLWGWGGGKNNEIWKIAPTGVTSPEYFHIKSGCGGYLASDAANHRAVIGPADDRAKWQLDVWIEHTYNGTGAAVGIAMQNAANGLYLGGGEAAYGEDSIVLGDGSGLTSPMPTWNFAAVGGFVPGAPRWLAIRKDGTDTGHNLNVKGGCGNTEVTVWPWGDGQSNEVWSLERL